MTPLAKGIVEQRLLPVKRRTIEDDGGLLTRMDDIHCFECTEAWQIAIQLTETAVDKSIKLFDLLGFLPAPKTWLEWVDRNEKGRLARYGMLWEAQTNTSFAEIFFAIQPMGGCINTISDNVVVPLRGNPLERELYNYDESKTLRFATFLYLLAIINSPRVVNRRQHLPNSALERKLLHAMAPQGKYPLHAWTEIKLEIAAPKDMQDDGPYEAHLTGKRALHFVRSHIRVRLGQLEFVGAHWRGDASVGIKQSRYKLEAA